jgi:hypothetical protein
MTLQVRSTDTITGIPIKRIRNFFRYLVSWHQHSFELPRLQEQLSLDKESALALASELEAQGYINPPENGTYEFTDKGEELVRASAAGNISRKTAEAALAGLLERVEQYNSDPDKVLAIEAVIVFGSFLGPKEKLGDLDIAVKVRDRNPTDLDRAATALAYAERSGRHFSNFMEWICWPNTELFQILKASKRIMKIQDWDSFLRLAEKNSGRFNYKVVFGGSEELAAEIRTRTENKA